MLHDWGSAFFLSTRKAWKASNFLNYCILCDEFNSCDSVHSKLLCQNGGFWTVRLEHDQVCSLNGVSMRVCTFTRQVICLQCAQLLRCSYASNIGHFFHIGEIRHFPSILIAGCLKCCCSIDYSDSQSRDTKMVVAQRKD